MAAVRVLELSPALKLPVDAVTETFAILGKRGGGKTYCASVLVEEMLKAHLQVVVADPLGVWWGLRAAADGRGPGLGNVVILGGPHGDVPLEPAAGELVADLVVDEGLSVVLDLKELSKTQTRTFVTAFAERLYRRKRPDGEPVHLLLDEADTFVPQRYGAGDARMFGAFDDLVRKGRASGIGVTLISQRSAKINKDVLSQCEVLIAVRTTHPRDREAIAEWTEAHGTKDQVAELLAGLASLPTGEAYVWSPSWLEMFERVHIRRRETYDSSSTPKVGEQRRPPKKLAEVDLEGLRQRMATSIERAKAVDPVALRRRVAELEARLQQLPEPQVERVEIPVLADTDLAVLERLTSHLEATAQQLQTAADEVAGAAREVATRLDRRRAMTTPMPAPPPPPGTPRPARTAARPVTNGSTNGAGELPKAERLILTALAHYPQGRTTTQIAILTGYSARGGGFNNTLSALRSKGLAEGRDAVRATQAGIDTVGDVDPLPTGHALIEHWLTQPQLGRAERLIVTNLAQVWPDTMTKDQLATSAGYAASGGGFNNALSRLRTLELIEGRGDIRLSNDLFP